MIPIKIEIQDKTVTTIATFSTEFDALVFKVLISNIFIGKILFGTCCGMSRNNELT